MEISFKTKPTLGGDLVQVAAGWEIGRAPVLGDQAYGGDSKLRTRLASDGIEYVLAVGPDTTIFEPDTSFAAPPRRGTRGPRPSAQRPDREHRQVRALAASLPAAAFQTVAFRTTNNKEICSRFAFCRVIAANPVTRERQPPREEWLIVEWPQDKHEPTDYWLANLPADTSPERLARLARLRWMIELDYKQLKGELGLDHYEGRSWLGFHHHCALVTAAHGFLTLERQNPNRPRPA